MSSSRESSPSQSVTPADGVENWQRLVVEQQQTIQALQQTIQAQQQTIEKMERQLQQQQERIEQLAAELRAQKKLKGKPKIRASQLNDSKPNREEEGAGKRPGSEKVSKKMSFEIDEQRIVQPDEIPVGAKFNGYRDYDVQELKVERHNIRFRLAEYVSEDGTTRVGQLPVEYGNGHYGPVLLGYILYQYYQCRVTQPLLHEQLQEWGIEISTGQLNNILSENKERFHAEQQQVLRVGLETSEYIHTDDTGARHQGKNGYCTVIGNEWFAYFKSSDSKSRQNFLEVLQGTEVRYVLNEYAQRYLESQPLALKVWEQLSFSEALLSAQKSDWQADLFNKGIVSVKAVRMVSEAALLGGVMSQGMKPLCILSDGAGQFNVLTHGLCWVHAERGLRRLQADSPQQQQNIAEMQASLWQYYRQLQQYQRVPTSADKIDLWQAFDLLFGRCYLLHDSLNRVLQWFTTHKVELLRVLDSPQIPLHNNAAETDIREYVIRRKISGGTRSDAGRRARDTLVGLKKTCRKLGVSFWQYLLSRLRSDRQISPLSDLIRDKAAVALQVSVTT
jgi:Transposase IS66 family